jgi:hypothetical protein
MYGESRMDEVKRLDQSYDIGYVKGFRAGAEATQAAAVAMLERAQQPAAALGVSLMKLPEPPK